MAVWKEHAMEEEKAQYLVDSNVTLLGMMMVFVLGLVMVH